jgi:hypothetical protein
VAVTLDHRALGRGMVTYLGIAAPCGLLIALLKGSDPVGHESNLWLAAALVIIVIAPFVAGAVAGGAQAAPMVHGAVAVAVPAGAFLLIRSVVGAVQNRLAATDVVSFLLYLVVFTALGMLGGYMGFRRRQHLA